MKQQFNIWILQLFIKKKYYNKLVAKLAFEIFLIVELIICCIFLFYIKMLFIS